MTFDKPKDQWDRLDHQDREYMNIIRGIERAMAEDPKTFLAYLKMDKELYRKLLNFLNANIDYDFRESKSL